MSRDTEGKDRVKPEVSEKAMRRRFAPEDVRRQCVSIWDCKFYYRA